MEFITHFASREEWLKVCDLLPETSKFARKNSHEWSCEGAAIYTERVIDGCSWTSDNYTKHIPDNVSAVKASDFIKRNSFESSLWLKNTE